MRSARRLLLPGVGLGRRVGVSWLLFRGMLRRMIRGLRLMFTRRPQRPIPHQDQLSGLARFP
ncbi:hypothetical protein LAWI1_G008536 [Lachnellula willkommii]|uniref:Uncharacterized protein n=1 Tax=Lachnellula willkommii TaxID=215461 RepID=A0A559M088_9HELO|nr:hypothetical protein LAWI1_G008536 [Lachnellula willkommii]